MAAPVVYTLPVVSTQGTTNKVDFSKDLPMDYEDAFPFTVLSTKMKDEKAENIVWSHAVGRQSPDSSLSTGAVVAAAVGATTTLNVAHGEYFVVGQVIEAPDTYNDATHTNQLYITSITANALTVEAYDPTNLGVAAIDSGATINVIAPAPPEKWEGSTGQQTEPTVYDRYCQTFEEDFSLSDTQANIWQYTHPERTRLREEIRLRMLEHMEKMRFVGKGVKDVSTSTNPRYQMHGLEQLITTNVFHYQAALDMDELYSYMQTIHAPAYSAGNARLVFASAGFLSQLNKLIIKDGPMKITPSDKTWGPKISKLQFVAWEWDLVLAPVLTKLRDGQAVVTVPRYLKTKTFTPMAYEMNIRIPGYTYFKDRFFGQQGQTIAGPEETFAWIKP